MTDQRRSLAGLSPLVLRSSPKRSRCRILMSKGYRVRVSYLRNDGSQEGIGREGLQVKDLVFGREDQA